MKKKILDLFIVVSFVILLLEIFLHKNLISDVIFYSLDVWVNSLIPSMFPFFVISDIFQLIDKGGSHHSAGARYQNIHPITPWKPSTPPARLPPAER